MASDAVLRDQRAAMGEASLPEAVARPIGQTADCRYKRPFDLSILIVSHVLFLPFLALLWAGISLAIWLSDRGPIFYTQERLGWNGRRFMLIKFRTMRRDAEALTGPIWALKDDDRVTPVGKVLRKLRLDEMPQVINLLRGDLSLVGPRPERPMLAEEFDRVIPGFSRRLQVRPGIAGLAQVQGNYHTHPRDKLRYDILYIKRMSPWLDLKLLALSFIVVLKQLWSD